MPCLQLTRRTGLNATDSRQSGNPVPWLIPQASPSLLAMVHTRADFHSYAHWALRLDPDSLKVTHVSAGAVLQTAAYYTEGYLRGVLTVGSFHVLDSPQGQVCKDLHVCEVQTPAGRDPCMAALPVHGPGPCWWLLSSMLLGLLVGSMGLSMPCLAVGRGSKSLVPGIRHVMGRMVSRLLAWRLFPGLEGPRVKR